MFDSGAQLACIMDTMRMVLRAPALKHGRHKTITLKFRLSNAERSHWRSGGLVRACYRELVIRRAWTTSKHDTLKTRVASVGEESKFISMISLL